MQMGDCIDDECTSSNIDLPSNQHHDKEYVLELEERIKFLEKDCIQKDINLRKMAVDAEHFIDESSRQAEERLDRMLLKMNEEIKHRQNIEAVAIGLQNENAKLMDELNVCHTFGGNCPSNLVASLQMKIEELNKFAESLNMKLTKKTLEVEYLEKRRQMEMKAVIDVTKLFQERIFSIQNTLNTLQDWKEYSCRMITELKEDKCRLEEEAAFLKIQSYSSASAGFADEDLRAASDDILEQPSELFLLPPFTASQYSHSTSSTHSQATKPCDSNNFRTESFFQKIIVDSDGVAHTDGN